MSLVAPLAGHCARLARRYRSTTMLDVRGTVSFFNRPGFERTA